MIAATYNGRKLSIRPTTRVGVSLDMFVNGTFVGSTRQGNSLDAQITALRKLAVMVDRADNARKPELYESFWFDMPAPVNA
jgi:hypothetical protein